MKQITSLIRDERPDLLHCHNIYHQLTPSIINAASRQNIPVVLTLHDYKTVCPVYSQLWNGELCTKCSDGRFEVATHAALRRWFDRAERSALGRSPLSRGGSQLSTGKRVYRPKPIHARRRRPSPRREQGNPHPERHQHFPHRGVRAAKKALFSISAAFHRKKGLRPCCGRMRQTMRSWRLVVAGSGPLLEDLRSRFPLAEFKGHLTGKALETTLRKASVVVMPSEWHENSPLSILEAMAHAKPIVASRIGGIPELVRDGETGLLFEPKDTQQLSNCIRMLAERFRPANKAGPAGSKDR